MLWGEVARIVEEVQEHLRVTLHEAQGWDRRRINKRLGDVAKRLDELDRLLADPDPNFRQVILRLFRVPLGELLSHRGFGDLLKEPMSYHLSRSVENSRAWAISRD